MRSALPVFLPEREPFRDPLAGKHASKHTRVRTLGVRTLYGYVMSRNVLYVRIAPIFLYASGYRKDSCIH